ncbi:hypothetical protein HOG21_01215 [bacterium]|nr:hypothetical protein [bacterium]
MYLLFGISSFLYLLSSMIHISFHINFSISLILLLSAFVQKDIAKPSFHALPVLQIR